MQLQEMSSDVLHFVVSVDIEERNTRVVVKNRREGRRDEHIIELFLFSHVHEVHKMSVCANQHADFAILIFQKLLHIRQLTFLPMRPLIVHIVDTRPNVEEGNESFVSASVLKSFLEPRESSFFFFRIDFVFNIKIKSVQANESEAASHFNRIRSGFQEALFHGFFVLFKCPVLRLTEPEVKNFRVENFFFGCSGRLIVILYVIVAESGQDKCLSA